jgi:hypothetical protein
MPSGGVMPKEPEYIGNALVTVTASFMTLILLLR